MTVGARDDQGLTGLQELAVAIGVTALLGVGALFTFHVLVNGSNDRSVQATVSTALTAANDVYQESQDYGLIASATPSPDGTGTCSVSTGDFAVMKAYADDVDFACGGLTHFKAGVVLYSSGELTDGDAGGWIGMAARARDGICWQAYKPADGPAAYGSISTATCKAPVSAPANGGADW